MIFFGSKHFCHTKWIKTNLKNVEITNESIYNNVKGGNNILGDFLVFSHAKTSHEHAATTWKKKFKSAP